ncbi:MAG: EscF/YscF/HrpA family type III secretion system needle major subunit [Acidobacteria bacterium]|nr:EscF/YscF/HrpA family type III secretion system needle major subunit [Acidobacteriota bacterium]MDW7983148.1 EscF/YscF/HrpA family type III secretion system needle major subunit [Acidobacteriota bacterium]
MLPIVATLVKLAPVLAPVVKDVAAGVVRGLTKPSRPDLPGMADEFSRISGDFLSRLVSQSDLPGSLPAIIPGGCIPPPERSKNWKLPLIFPPDSHHLILDRLMTQVDHLLDRLTRLADLVTNLLRDLFPQKHGPVPDKSLDPKGLYTDMARAEASAAPPPTEGTARPPGASAPPGSTPPSGPPASVPVPRGRTDSTPVSTEGLGGRALERLFDDMNSVESQINGLDPNDPKAQFRLMQLQQKMQRLTQMINLIAEMRKALHDTSMAIIRNIR